MPKFLGNSEAEHPSTSHIKSLPFELIETILDYLDVTTLERAIRTSKFLRYPSEQRLYHQVAFPTFSNSWDAQARFLETIVQNDRLAQHVVKLVLGRSYPLEAGDVRINRSIGQAMKKLVNLKDLHIYGYPYIVNAHLDSVPFSLTHLVVSGEKTNYTDPDPPLLSILQAHPTLEELALDFIELPRDLLSALAAERDGLTSESSFLCPKLKQFDGCDIGLRTFLPMRRIESIASLGRGADGIIDMELHLSIWLDPMLKLSYQHIRVLEAWPNEDDYIWLFPTIAPYLTSLTHLCIFDDVRALARHNYDLLSALGKIQTLQSITLSSAGTMGITMVDVQDAVRHVRGALQDIKEILVGLEEEGQMVYYRYAKGEGMQVKVVDQDVACRPYTRWLRDP